MFYAFQFIKNFCLYLNFFGFLSNFNVYSSSKKILYSKKSIAGYFSGIISSNNNNNTLALKYFNNLHHLKNSHDQFNHRLVFSLVQTQKIPDLFLYLKKLKKENLNFFNANLLLGINYFLEKKYTRSIDYFNLITSSEKFSNFEKLTAQSLLNYIEVFASQRYDRNAVFKSIPENYKNFAFINDAFINCYLDNENVNKSFSKIVDTNTLNFKRYNFFYANFLISKSRKSEALEILKENSDGLNANLLLNQALTWIENGKQNKIRKVFDCRNPNHLIGEFFYLIANLHSSEENHALSNFYLNLSLYLNPNFIFNNALLAENYFHLEDYQNSKKIYSKFNPKSSIYHVILNF